MAYTGTYTFSCNPRVSNANSYSYDWPNRYAPADDGSCSDNVAMLVLSTYDIPVRGARPRRGNLCGLDINNMSAEEAILLSLAENMADGRLVEVYMDADGFAYFQEVYPNAETISLDVRLCVPTYQIDNKKDLVIVRGYDPPPVRTFKSFEPLQWDPVESLALHIPEEDAPFFNYSTEAWKSYKDPVLETAYGDGRENLYELNAFEQCMGYVIDINSETDPNIKYSFSDTTTRLVDICKTTCLPVGDHYLGSFMAEDKFGEPWPLLLSVSAIYVWGRDVLSLSTTPASAPGFGNTKNNVGVHCSTDVKLVNLPATNWHWTLDIRSGATVHIYGGGNPEDVATKWIYDTFTNVASCYADYFTRDGHYVSERSDIGMPFIPNVNGSIGLYCHKVVAAVEIDRPSVTISDPNGEAIKWTQLLKVEYQPVIVIDLPPPVAYCMGGRARLVDHTLDLFDADPCTAEEEPALREGSLAWLQTQTSGRTIDISLPFLSDTDCLSMASTIYSMHDELFNSYSLVCGPEAEPKLGCSVPGFSGRIDKISYSFTDASAYNINVTVGPTFKNIRGWQTSIYQKQTEDVSRQGIIVWTAGDGVNYRVKLQGGMGVYHAVNMTLGVYEVGEKVQVTVHNNPKEV